MPIETSHGKARPTLPRSSDLRPLDSERLPAEGRDAKGHFLPGNRHSVGQGVKATIARLLGGDRRARRLYRAALRELPSAGTMVRLQLVELARVRAAGADVWEAAMAAGLDTPAGAELEARAVRLGERAERLAITAWDLASKRTGVPVDATPPGLSPFAVPRGGR